MAQVWDGENLERLFTAETDEELAIAFPGQNLETLKRTKRRYREQFPLIELDLDEPAGNTPAGSIETFGDSGTITTGTLDAPVKDWSKIFEVWGMDPERFEIIEPVRMSAWDAGDTRKYSYKARFKARESAVETTEPKFDVSGWVERLRALDLSTEASTKNYTKRRGYVVCPTDSQLGKPGTDEALKNIRRGIYAHVKEIQNLLDLGTEITEIVIAFCGDETEGVANFYPTQTFEVELNYSQQIELDFETRIWIIAQFMPFGVPLKVVSVISNHGEMGRNGSNKTITSVYDNASTMVARMVRQTLQMAHPDFPISWHIADEEQDVIVDIAGVRSLFTHGHLMVGSGKTSEFRMKNALEKQILGRTKEMADIQLFVAGHYHHFYVLEDRGRTFIGLPALEADSNGGYFMEKFGVWSRAGLVGFTVSADIPRGWESINVY